MLYITLSSYLPAPILSIKATGVLKKYLNGLYFFISEAYLFRQKPPTNLLLF